MQNPRLRRGKLLRLTVPGRVRRDHRALCHPDLCRPGRDRPPVPLRERRLCPCRGLPDAGGVQLKRVSASALPDAVAGDITAAMPYRAMTNIINFIQAMDQVVPGFASYETLLYSPELKFYSNRIRMDENLTTSIEGLHCLGDSSGWTRGLMMASCMGVLMGRKLFEMERA